MPRVFHEHDLDFSGCDLIGTQDMMNIIVNQGKDTVINSLVTGYINPIVRMAVGDRGTISSDPTSPRVAQPTQTSLFNEIYRDKIEATFLLSQTTPGAHGVQFIKTVSASSIPPGAYGNQANPVISEVGLISADILTGLPIASRPAIYDPADAPADEKLFAIRTFKSVPFEASNDISVTIRYTIFIE